MKDPIFKARGKWSMPYKTYFENGHKYNHPVLATVVTQQSEPEK